jgi:hypothetical protein
VALPNESSVPSPPETPAAGKAGWPRALLRTLWVVVVLVFLLAYVRANWAEFRAQAWRFDISWTTAGVACGLIRKLLAGIRWVMLVKPARRDNGVDDVSASLESFFLSNLAAYLPGGVWHMVQRVQMAGRAGQSRAQVSVGLLYESALLVWSGLVVGSYAATLAAPQRSTTILAAVVAVSLLSLVFLHPRTFSALATRVVPHRYRPVSVAAGTVRYVVVLGISVGIWISGGLALLCLAMAFDAAVSWAMLVDAISAGALAWTIGFLTPWAPAGLGVREGLLVWLLSFRMAAGTALAAAVAFRLSAVVEDLVWAGVAVGMRRRRSGDGVVE